MSIIEWKVIARLISKIIVFVCHHHRMIQIILNCAINLIYYITSLIGNHKGIISIIMASKFV